MALHYRRGDATYPQNSGHKIIVHICNNIGVWGGGFTKSLSRRWRQPEVAYRNLRVRPLGSVEFIEVDRDISVANIIGQHSIISRTRRNGRPPIRYEAIRTALKSVAVKCAQHQSTVHMPRIGTGLAGGNWQIIESIIKQELVNAGIVVYVYDL